MNHIDTQNAAGTLFEDFTAAKILSPRRSSTTATDIDGLALEQLVHFGIDPESDYGKALYDTARGLYLSQGDVSRLCEISSNTIASLDKKDRIGYFNAKKFLSFQIAKILHNLQAPFRESYNSLSGADTSFGPKGSYPVFDNVTAIFSANPVITRTATYIYACTEWAQDAFEGKEFLHDIYSRLLNPTSISLANQMVELEAGPLSGEYFAWNFSSGMAAIDTTLAHVLGHQDIVICSRNVYGGTYQLLEDWYCKESNLDIGIQWVDGHDVQPFSDALKEVREKYKDRLAAGRNIYIFLESPCNPHGYVLDVAGICKMAHEVGITVICDSTVGTPMLHPVLRREDPMERPDYVIHSYTKDLAGSGVTTAGVCIARNENMFIPKGESVTAKGPDGKTKTFNWDQTLFWNVYYIKGAFLESDKAFEVINGMRTLELRLLPKSINTTVLARALSNHPQINVSCPAVDGNENAALSKKHMFLGLPAPLFTIDFDGKSDDISPVNIEDFKRFFDSLEPAFGHQVSLGQGNTVVLCPALTSHSELTEEALRCSGITPTTIRISVGNEDPRSLIAHFIRAAEMFLEADCPGFVEHLPNSEEIDELYESVYLDVHKRFIKSRPTLADMLK